MTRYTISVYDNPMAAPTKKVTLKQVAVRFSPALHKLALRRAKEEGISFGELVRRAVEVKCK